MSAPDPSAVESISVCAVCAERYDGRCRRPKLLGCGHTFCLGCLLEIAARGRAQDGGVPCPVCRRPTEIPGPGVMHLPDNFAIVGYISGREGPRGGPKGRCDSHPDERLKFFCLSCHRLLCPCCAFKHKSQTPHHNIEEAESAALRYKENILSALDYCREKQTLLDKTVRDSTCQLRWLEGLSLSLEHLVNKAHDTELLSLGRSLAGLEGFPPPNHPSPVPPAFWAFARFPHTDDNEDDSSRPGTLLPPNAGPNAPNSGQADERLRGENGGGGGAAQPVGVAVAPNGIALVTDLGGRGVRALDLNGDQGAALRRAQAAGAGLGAGACAGVAVSSLGYLVVLAQPRSGSVSAHARDGRRLFRLQLGWRRPFGVAVTARGRVAVSDRCESGTLSVLTVDWTRGSVLHLQRVRGLRRPGFLACSEDDAIAVAARDSVHLYDGAGALVWTSGPDQGIFRPTGVAFDGERNVIVADRSCGKVVLLSRDGRLLRCVIQGLAGPQGVALSPSGVLVIADRGNEALIKHPYQPVHAPPQPPAFTG